MNITLIYS